MIEDEGVIFSNLPRGRGDDDDEDRRARSRAWMNLRNANQEGPLRPRPSGVGGPSINQGAAPVTTSVWSASDAAANGMTLSNGGLTVQATATSAWGSIRGSVSKTSGKLYVEFLANSTPGIAGYSGEGFASSGFIPTNYLGTSNYSGGVTENANHVSTGFTSNYVNTPTPLSSDVWALAIDFTAGSIWVARNNVWVNSSNPASGSLPMLSFVPATVGALFPAISMYGIASEKWTLQPTAASQKYLPPPGFQAWDGGPVTPSTSVWSAADAAANGFTLSNGGLTYTNNAVVTKAIRGTVSHTSGKFYVEFLCNVSVGNYQVGLASSGFNIGGNIGASLYSGGYGYGANVVSAGFTSNYTSLSYANDGHVWGMAVDFSTGSIWFSFDGGWLNSSNPTTGSLPMISFVPATVGPLFPVFVEDDANHSWTLQPTAASQTYAPPAGFTAWDGAGGHSAQALAYLARTVGGNEGGNGTNIANLIDGLVADGVWAKLDCLYVLAQQNSTDAKLNLIGTSYSPLVPFGSPSFTSYVGYGPFINTNLDTGFNANTAPSPNYTRNSASYGVWSYAVVDENYAVMGNGAGGSASIMYTSFTAGAFYARLNDASAGSVPTPGSKGLFVGDRSTSTNVIPYWNGAAQAGLGSTSGAIVDATFTIGASQGFFAQDAPAPRIGTGQTLSAAFIGASLGSAGQLALYNRLRTYMSSIGVP